ncbi:hypothetical protein HUJ05_006966 [Dendroctonus ponderosae]|nr:hypothetical protein HUJ05_006966 [Dendroctonus ponderosae]
MLGEELNTLFINLFTGIGLRRIFARLEVSAWTVAKPQKAARHVKTAYFCSSVKGNSLSNDAKTNSVARMVLEKLRKKQGHLPVDFAIQKQTAQT